MKRLSGVLVVAVTTLVGLADTPAPAQSTAAKPPAPSTEWPTYNHDRGGQRFSPLTQLTPANVGQLQVAWVYHMRPTPVTPPAAAPPVEPPPPPPAGRGRGRGRGSGFAVSQVTPVVVNGVMFITTPYGRVVALDPTTGKELWAFPVPNGTPTSRGVEYWAGDAKTPAQIVFGSNDGRLFSLNAQTGQPNRRVRRRRHRSASTRRRSCAGSTATTGSRRRRRCIAT